MGETNSKSRLAHLRPEDIHQLSDVDVAVAVPEIRPHRVVLRNPGKPLEGPEIRNRYLFSGGDIEGVEDPA